MSFIPYLGVCYYPEHWPESQWEKDAQNMVKLGLSLVRIGEFAWSRIQPNPDTYAFAWLERAVNILGEAGLGVIIGTPSATPPRWMLDTFPDMLAYDKEGRARKFGARRHYCLSHEGYRAASADMAGQLAERFSCNPHVVGWQIDNEYGCHETIRSYSPVARAAFQDWLRQKYESIETLNAAWGNVFWSMEYASFTDIGLPNLTVTEPNPSHVLDFYRFSSDQVVAFNQAQIKAIQQYCHKPLIHNYMGRITDVDHFDLGVNLNMASWDSYPLGFLEDRSDQSEDFRHAYHRQGDPDFQAFHHDLYRAVGRGRWGIMEQQPGPVNWAPYNPAPLPGMVRLWTWEALAHSAEFVCYFRWRQVPFGQEQMHAALRLPDDSPATVWSEIAQTAQEINSLFHTDNMVHEDKLHPPILELKSVRAHASQASVALVFDYVSQWAREIQPQGEDVTYFRLIYAYYAALRRLGVDVDIISARSKDLSDYRLCLVPGLMNLGSDLCETLREYDGQIIMGPFTDHKTPDFHHSITPLSKLGLNLHIEACESLRPTQTLPIEYGKGAFKFWREFITHNHETVSKTEDGYTAHIKSGRINYICGWPDDAYLSNFLKDALAKAGIAYSQLPGGLRKRTIGPYTVWMNYSAHTVDFEGIQIEAAGIRIFDNKTGELRLS